MSSLRIALTGGIACGKSTVGKIFQTLGAEVISLDALSREVVEPGTAGLIELTRHFGAQILDDENRLDRAKLRSLLLESEDNKQTIEQILHPKILKNMEIKIENCKKPLIIVEIPLLVEKNLEKSFDRAIIVRCNEKNQLKRLENRENIDENQAKQLIKSQCSDDQRLEVAQQLPTDIINNNADATELEQQVTQLYQRLINL